MKKSFLIINCMVIVVVSIILGKYYDYKAKYSELKEYNLQYEAYLEKEVYGTEIATVINKAVHNNEKNEVEKEEVVKNENTYYFYKQNDINSLKVEVKITDNNKIYQMESLYQGEIEQFVKHYNTILFKCTKIEYNSTGKVSYMLFEQISD